LLVLALGGLAACGDDDDDAGSESDKTTTQADGQVSADDCTKLALRAQTSGPSVEGNDDPKASADFFQTFAETGPSEIRSDLLVVADAYKLIAQAYAEAGVESTDGTIPPDKALAVAQAFSELNGRIDQGKLQTASANITAWAREHCATTDTGA
jgi:hypothetical protein